jgi:hypothetical protein
MKNMVSIDGDLLHEPGEVAQPMGLSRRRLFELAVDDYSNRHREKQMLRKLNEVYAAPVEPAEKWLLKISKEKFIRTAKESW